MYYGLDFSRRQDCHSCFISYIYISLAYIIVPILSSNHDMWVFKMLDIVVRQIGHCLRDEQQLWQQTKWPHGTIVTSLSLFRQILQIDICSALSNSSIISDKMSFSSSSSLALSISTIAAFCVDNKEVLCECFVSQFSSIIFAVDGGLEKSRSLLVHCLLFG